MLLPNPKDLSVCKSYFINLASGWGNQHFYSLCYFDIEGFNEWAASFG